MNRLGRILLLVSLAFQAGAVRADDYAFDVGAVAPKRFEVNYRLDLRPGLTFLDQGTRQYRLTPAAEGRSRFQTNTAILAGAQGSYKAGGNSTFLFDGLLTTNRFLGQTRDSQVMNEAWMRFNLDSRLEIGVGKKTFKWGKGYAWNPVNFAGRQKDLNDIDLALEGYGMAFSQYTRSMKGRVSNLTLTMALLPVTAEVNDDFTAGDSLHVASQLYLLVGDTDIDLNLMLGTAGNHKIGVDFSRNLSSNHEIHAEIAHELEGRGAGIAPDGRSAPETSAGTNVLLGTRYLDRRDITYILEYLRHGNGLRQSEMESFFQATDLALAKADQKGIRQAAQTFTQFLARQFPMREYLYVKASKPELWGDLYLNGAFFAIFNATDKSCSTTAEWNYTRMTNKILTLRVSRSWGNPNSEFGQKMSSDKIECRYQVFF